MKTKFKTFTFYALFTVCILAFTLSVFIYTQKSKTITTKTENKVVSSTLSILMVGDIMTDRYIRKQISVAGSAENFVNVYLNNIPELNKDYDYVVANLEGPITEHKSKVLNDDGSYSKDLVFTFPTSTIQILNLLNIKIVSLANNHTDNFYNAGYKSTQKFLKEAGINYFGNPYNQEENLSNIFCQKEICVAYIGYNQFTSNNDSDIIIKEIKRLKNPKENKEVDFTIVLPHFGDEYQRKANKNQEKLAKDWIDAGADAVIGSHPHVIQNSEIYKDKYIYYSIGNYIFDQWFTDDVQNGLGVNIVFEKVTTGMEGDDDYKVMSSISIKEENNKNIFIDRNGVRYK